MHWIELFRQGRFDELHAHSVAKKHAPVAVVRTAGGTSCHELPPARTSLASTPDAHYSGLSPWERLNA